MENHPLVTLVIPVHNNKEDTKECLESLKQVTYPNYKIIIVDDGSTDGTEEMLGEEYHYITVLKGDSTLWSSRAFTLGAEKAISSGSDYLLWIDNDTVVAPDFILALVETAQRNSRAVVVSKVYYYDEPRKLFDAGGVMNWWAGGFVQRGRDELDTGRYDAECQVKYGSSGILIPAYIFRDCGGLDYDHFPHFKAEVDFLLRVSKMGYKTIFQPRSRIWHKTRRTAQKHIYTSHRFISSPWRTLWFALSHRSRGAPLSFREFLRFYLRHYPLPYIPYAVAWAVMRRLVREVRGPGKPYQGKA